MRLFRWALIVGLVAVLGMAIQQSLLWLGIWGSVAESQVKALEDGDQEIALIEPATSTEDWGRIVTALKLVQADWAKTNPDLPSLRVDFAQAFPRLTVEVPEISFSHSAKGSRLRLRWYKISGEHDVDSWVKKLKARNRPPLAVIGGGTSDRAIKLAYSLKREFGDDPDQPSPVFLITTATSEFTTSRKSLIDVYRGRAFRFSFTNQKMVDGLLGFVHQREFDAKEKDWAESLWVGRSGDPQEHSLAVLAGVGFAAIGKHGHGPYMHSITWEDERYSQDMTDLFEEEFKKRYPAGEFNRESPIRHGVGGFFQPTSDEQNVIGTFLARPTMPNTFMVLPTQTVRMRRFLINLRQRSPQDARNLVVLNGDAISFHSVYRDRDVLWNILDLPYSLVFFSHRNPIDRAAGFTWKRDADGSSTPHRTTSGTHDILLYRDLFEAMLYAAYDRTTLLSDPLRVRTRLQATQWYYPAPENMGDDRAQVRNPMVHAAEARVRPFFNAKGDRQNQTGEHIVWVKPSFSEDRVDSRSKISVWTIVPDSNGGAWRLVEAADATYNQ